MEHRLRVIRSRLVRAVDARWLSIYEIKHKRPERIEACAGVLRLGQDNRSFAPGLGVTYKVTEKLVARVGAGLFYAPASAMVSFDAFDLTERLNGQFRAEFLNAFNHPTYGGVFYGGWGSNIDLCIDCGSLGTVYGTRNDPRNIQFSMKLMF